MAPRVGPRFKQPEPCPATGRTAGPPWPDLARALTALLALWLLAPAPLAQAWTAPVDISPALTTLRPGAEVTLSWGTLPAGAEEFELLLVSDGPASLTFRLTESMDPSTEYFRWRVPNVPCTRARILVRMGDGDEERAWAESGTFGIAWDEEAQVAAIRERGGEFWLSEEPTRASTSLLSEGGPSVDRTLPGRREEARGTAPSNDLHLPRGASGIESAPPAPRAASPEAVARRRRASLSLPLRI